MRSADDLELQLHSQEMVCVVPSHGFPSRPEECPYGRGCIRVCRVPDADIFAPSAFTAPDNASAQQWIHTTAVSEHAPPGAGEIYNVNFWGVALEQPKPEQQQEYRDRSACLKAPLLFLTRDYTNVFHFLKDQLLPAFYALSMFGAQDQPFHLALIKSWPHVETLSPLDVFAPEFELISGNPLLPLDGGLQIFERVCADQAIIGAHPAFLHMDVHWMQSILRIGWEAETAFDRQLLQAYRSWLFGKYRVPPPAALQPWAAAEDVVVTIIKRPVTQRRSILNPAVLESAFSLRGVRLQTFNFAKLTVRQQMEVASNTSILVSAHGAAITWLAWLPVGGVSVELMPYNFKDGADCYSCFRDWAQLANISHGVWHNRDRSLTFIVPGKEEDKEFKRYGKHHHTLLTMEAAEEIANAAMQQFHVPLEQRNYDQPYLVNEVDYK